ncbi:MAG: hypothetical protein PVI35_00485 [Acidimicrobiia bacterium]|jgi:hypothetical protein
MGGPARFRWIVAVAVGSLSLAACSHASDTTTTATAPEAESAPEPITVDVEADLAAHAVQKYCAAHCADLVRYVYNTTFTATMPDSTHRAMPAAVRAAIEATGAGFQFVTGAEANALFGPDGLVDEGRGILLNVGPVEPLTDRVVGIEVGGITGHDAGLGMVIQYEWDGTRWAAVTPEQSGVTVTTWVS